MEVELSLYLNHVKYKSAINYRQYTVKVFICGDYEFCQRCMACQEPAVCTSGILNASIM